MTTEASSQGFLFDDGQPLNLKKKIFFWSHLRLSY
jgi:hypothetical protein